jgi:precorrin-3B C17-methyltransferase
MDEQPLQSHDKRTGKLCIVGTGPGSIDQLTVRAERAIEESEYIIGNARYLDLLRPLIEGKTVIRSSMGKEVERAERALALAEHHPVAIVSGGDPGVYGMASIVLEILDRRGIAVPVEVIPGVTAAQAAASRLGSPLSGDHVTISLSDLLTPWEEIERRLSLAFAMGVPVAIYNPRSKGRPDHLARAVAIAGRHRSGETPVGIVQNAYREGEKVMVMRLADLEGCLDLVDMHSIVIIGGEESRRGRIGSDGEGIITPRGYHTKYLY